MLDYLLTVPLVALFQLGFLLILGPVIYLTLVKLAYGEFGSLKHNIWHLLPVVLSLILAEVPAHLITFAAILQLVYMIASMRLVRSYHRAAFAMQADAESKLLIWMYIPALVVGALSLTTMLFLLGLFETNIKGFQVWLVLYFAISCITFLYVILRAFFTKDLFKELKNYEAAQDAPLMSLDKQQRRNLKDEFKQVERLIEEKELFRQTDLSIHTVSEETGFDEREITLAISQEAGVNFCDYVNGLRVAAVKRCIDEGKLTYDIVIEKAMSMGFITKRSFAKLFKRFAGMAPTQYIKEIDKQHV